MPFKFKKVDLPFFSRNTPPSDNSIATQQYSTTALNVQTKNRRHTISNASPYITSPTQYSVMRHSWYKTMATKLNCTLPRRWKVKADETSSLFSIAKRQSLSETGSEPAVNLVNNEDNVSVDVNEFDAIESNSQDNASSLSSTSRRDGFIHEEKITTDFVQDNEKPDLYMYQNNRTGKVLPVPAAPINSPVTSLFERFANMPRQYSEKPEVLGKVGRFTIVREREDFDSTLFDQCHL
ncbi:5034_t:CDS:1 [Paraglomus occultum]|uniref:5034_t:CDS:1 n=1 Tax=Paraglomus occultum TaxID=144539 RepID=A0A9N9AMP6_9GLOM|nr:5034_t:CDS:1 [Paraglomus occultum]